MAARVEKVNYWTATPILAAICKSNPSKKRVDAVGLDVPTELVKTLTDLDAKTRATVLLQLMNFLFPKRKAVEHTGTNDASAPPELTKEQLKARVEEDQRRLSEMETPEEKAERKARLDRMLKMYDQLRGRGEEISHGA